MRESLESVVQFTEKLEVQRAAVRPFHIYS